MVLPAVCTVVFYVLRVLQDWVFANTMYMYQAVSPINPCSTLLRQLE